MAIAVAVGGNFCRSRAAKFRNPISLHAVEQSRQADWRTNVRNWDRTWPGRQTWTIYVCYVSVCSTKNPTLVKVHQEQNCICGPTFRLPDPQQGIQIRYVLMEDEMGCLPLTLPHGGTCVHPIPIWEKGSGLMLGHANYSAWAASIRVWVAKCMLGKVLNDYFYAFIRIDIYLFCQTNLFPQDNTIDDVVAVAAFLPATHSMCSVWFEGGGGGFHNKLENCNIATRDLMPVVWRGERELKGRKPRFYFRQKYWNTFQISHFLHDENAKEGSMMMPLHRQPTMSATIEWHQ